MTEATTPNLSVMTLHANWPHDLPVRCRRWIVHRSGNAIVLVPALALASSIRVLRRDGTIGSATYQDCGAFAVPVSEGRAYAVLAEHDARLGDAGALADADTIAARAAMPVLPTVRRRRVLPAH